MKDYAPCHRFFAFAAVHYGKSLQSVFKANRDGGASCKLNVVSAFVGSRDHYPMTPRLRGRRIPLQNLAAHTALA